ncbi:MAG: asparagine synthase (glutamine-hydrolyzing) [Deltaproteobacteria bacterium]|nr:asparagine synthase (glutamine-hydrolyzing) [Deltaproteobacteria bacterium]
MCGIYGHVVDIARAEAHEGALTTAVKALSHRGPDASGTARLADARGRVECGLAHTRLAILDLSPAGAQPMTQPGFDGGRRVLVFNGEIYNYRELRAELEALGQAFVSDSDTEVVLHALATWGEQALERFVGMFALALFDVASGVLFLARDRLGKKPLYLVDGRAGFAFASEVRTLVATGWASRAIDPAALAAYLARGSVHEPTALLAGVVSLAAGHWLRVSPDGRRQLHMWWRVPDPEDRPSVGGDPEAAEDRWGTRLVEVLHEAVRVRLVSDVPLGVFLSGGIDSAAIVSLASRLVGDQLRTFTLTFDEAAFDESSRAAATARHFGVHHHEAHLSGREALHDVERAFAAQDLPSHDGINTWVVTRAAREAGLVVALSGAGGDEVFAGYRHFRTFDLWVRAGRAARFLPRGLRELALSGLDPRVGARARKALGLLGTGGDPRATYALVREVLSPRQIVALLPGLRRDAASLFDEGREARGDPQRVLTRLELEGYLRDTQLRDIDQMSMSHGFEVRAPLLDHRLIELVQTIPGAFKAPHDGLDKPLLVLASGLPEALFRTPKRGFVLPWETWLLGPLRAFAEDLIARPAPLSPPPVRDLWSRFLASPRTVGYSRILTLLSLIGWCRRIGATVAG